MHPVSLFITTAILLSTATAQWKIQATDLVFKNPPFRECHASTIVETTPGKFLVACFGGTAEGNKDVEIWLSRSNSKKWSKPIAVANGVVNDSLRYPTWNPVLFRPRNGPIHLFYKAGPSPREWWGMFKTSADGRNWSAAQRLPDGILGPIKNKPVQLGDSIILSPSSTETRDFWKVHLERSEDNGKTWRIIPVDDRNSFKVIQPTILIHPGNRLQILCRSNQDSIVTSWSEDNGLTWGKLTKTSLPNPNSGIDAITLKNGSHLLVYNPTNSGKAWMNGRGKLHVALSDDGKNWKDIAVLENGQDEEYSYPAIIQSQDGKVHITYTYNRKNIRHVVLVQE